MAMNPCLSVPSFEFKGSDIQNNSVESFLHSFFFSFSKCHFSLSLCISQLLLNDMMSSIFCEVVCSMLCLGTVVSINCEIEILRFPCWNVNSRRTGCGWASSFLVTVLCLLYLNPEVTLQATCSFVNSELHNLSTSIFHYRQKKKVVSIIFHPVRVSSILLNITMFSATSVVTCDGGARH